MNIGSLTIAVNNLADEDFSSSQIVQFVNDCIAKINIEANANFPFMLVEDVGEYAGFPEKWQRALFIPFVVGRMKAVDSSQFEYSDQYAEFQTNLNLFKMRFTIPDVYKDTSDKSSYEPSFDGNYFVWGSGSSNGSDPFA